MLLCCNVLYFIGLELINNCQLWLQQGGLVAHKWLVYRSSHQNAYEILTLNIFSFFWKMAFFSFYRCTLLHTFILTQNTTLLEQLNGTFYQIMSRRLLKSLFLRGRLDHFLLMPRVFKLKLVSQSLVCFSFYLHSVLHVGVYPSMVPWAFFWCSPLHYNFSS